MAATKTTEPVTTDVPTDPKAAARRRERQVAFDRLAPERGRWLARNAYYHRAVADLVRFYVPEGMRVLDVGCGLGDLLAATRPSRGLGVDISPATIELARARHPHLEFRAAEAETLDLGGETFDAVVLSDAVGHLDDVWAVFRRLQGVCRPETRVVVTLHNALWEPLLELAERVGAKMPTPRMSWLALQDIENLLRLNHFETVTSGTALLLPKGVPIVSRLINRVVAHLPGVRAANLVQFTVARPRWTERPPSPRPLSTSVIVPTRNERGTIADIFRRTPSLGPRTELIFVDGSSDDGTVEEIERLLPTRDARLIRQGDGRGKGDAVRKGMAAATGDVLMILDSDLTVPPEDLPKFWLALAEGAGEMINGTRLVYPMEDQAMRFANLIGNKLFSVALSAILGQPLKDTLCGTKALSARDYARLAANRAYFGEFDPFGDFDLLFGAAKLGLRITEVPIRYQARAYGETKISRWRHGLLLARMTATALRRFTFAW